MDIGTGGFTNFLDTADIISYRVDHPELLQPGVYEGLIHSHNNMSAFFSGTDINTLLEEGSNTHHFLSLIVNNAGKYVARITRKLVKKVKAEAHIVYTESSSYKTFESKEVVLTSNQKSESDKKEEKSEIVIEWYDMLINKQEVPQPFEEVNARLREIKRKKTYGNYVYSNYTADNNFVPVSAFTPVSKLSDTDSVSKKEVSYEIPNTYKATILNDDTDDFPPLHLVESADGALIKHLCMQLLCGSILIDGNSKLDIERWVRKMDSFYKNRFGDLDCRLLKHWIALFVEMLITNNPDPDYEYNIASKYEGEGFVLDTDACVEIYAYNMIQFLNTLPDSVVKQLMITELKTYLP